MSEATEKLLPPSEVLEDMPYQAVPPMSDEKYQRLAEDIKERGVIQPIVTDEEGNILDGHHRAAISKQLDLDESRKPTYVTLGDLEDDRSKLARAIKTNLLGRDIDRGVKSEAVKQYIETTWPTDDETGALVKVEEQGVVADKLGVSDFLVSDVVNNLGTEIIYHDRLKAREYYRDNPDASYRKVAEQVETSHPTVTEWLKEDFDEGNDEDEDDTEQPALNLFSRDEDEHEDSQDLVQQADEDEKAKERADRAAKRKGTVSRENHLLEREQKREKREQKREGMERAVEQPEIPDDNPTPKIIEADARDLPLDDESVNIIITSPPYNLGHDEWKFGGWGREGRESGIGYPDDRPEHEYQEQQLDVFEELFRVAQDGASLFYNHKPRQKDGSVIHPVQWLLDDRNPWTFRQEIVWNRKTIHNLTKSLFWNRTERIYWLTKGKPHIPEEGVAIPDLWEFTPDVDTDHPAPFPDTLPTKCLEAVGREGDVILDPFGGSMTTCEVAAKLGYQSIGVDRDPEYVERALARFGLGGDSDE